ncbi:hypothetical protein [Nitrosococcus wardiae]|uniref:hypothetical protein n=1 Tax=Nitrosococcus wardiae TaxID=1814290 RepID=UPI00141AD4CE|nr:hypothetical protein [Nitrosococcus wardiae]
MKEAIKNVFKSKDYKPKIEISGPGVVHVKSSEIVKTPEAKRQIKILGKLKKEGLLD